MDDFEEIRSLSPRPIANNRVTIGMTHSLSGVRKSHDVLGLKQETTSENSQPYQTRTYVADGHFLNALD